LDVEIFRKFHEIFEIFQSEIFHNASLRVGRAKTKVDFVLSFTLHMSVFSSDDGVSLSYVVAVKSLERV